MQVSQTYHFGALLGKLERPDVQSSPAWMQGEQMAEGLTATSSGLSHRIFLRLHTSQALAWREGSLACC